MEVLLLLDRDVRPVSVFRVGEKPTILFEVLPVGNVPPEVHNSFYGSALKAFSLLGEKGVRSPHSAFGYQMNDDTVQRIYGSSGGLAFAVAVMADMLGMAFHEAVGATGRINPEKGVVEKVGAINEKLAVALERVEGPAIFFYPRQNDSEINPALKTTAKRRNVRLLPLRTLDELFDFFQAQRIRQPRSRIILSRHRFGLSCLGLALLLLACLSLANATAVFLIEHEWYPAARIQLQAVHALAFWDGRVRNTWASLVYPLETVPLFKVRLATGREDTYPLDRIPPEFRLTVRDSFSFRIDPHGPTYVYILERRQDGSLKGLYPAARDAGPVTSSTHIPGAGVYFRLYGSSGSRDLYVVLSRWRCLKLEAAIIDSNTGLESHVDLNKYQIEEGSVQTKHIPIVLVP